MKIVTKQEFLKLPKGTLFSKREDVWYWFEEQFDVSVADLTWSRK